MSVSHILDAKGAAVVTSAPHRTLAELARLLTEKSIGAIVVVGADGGVLGILSERDIIRAVARGGEVALQDAASRHMTRDVVTATRNTTVSEAMSGMTRGRFRHLPVLDNGTLIGLVSIGDVVKHRVEEMEREKQSMLDYIGTA